MSLTSSEQEIVAEAGKQTAKWLSKQEFGNIMQIVLVVVSVSCFGFTAVYLIPEERKAITEVVMDITTKNNLTDEHQELEQTKQIEMVVGIVNRLLGKMEEVEAKLGSTRQ